MRQDNIQLVREHNHMKQACEEMRRLREDDQREVAEMRILHQQVPVQPSVPSTFMLTQLQMRAPYLVHLVRLPFEVSIFMNCDKKN